MVPVSDAEAARLMGAAEAEAKPPATQVAPPPSEPATEPNADSASQEAPTPTAEAPKAGSSAKAPDLSWMPDEYREGFTALPPEQQKYLKDVRAHLIRGADEKFQKAAALKKDAEFAQKLGTPEERAEYLAWRRERLEGKAPATAPKAEAPKRKWFDVASDEEFDALVEERGVEIARRVVNETLTAPQVQAQKVDEALEAYREAHEVEAPLWDAAIAALAKDRTDEYGSAYKGLTPELVREILPGYLRVARAETAAARPTPTLTTAKTASIKGSTPGAQTKPVPAYQREGRAATPEEFWKQHLAELGLSSEQMSALRVGGTLNLA